MLKTAHNAGNVFRVELGAVSDRFLVSMKLKRSMHTLCNSDISCYIENGD